MLCNFISDVHSKFKTRKMNISKLVVLLLIVAIASPGLCQEWTEVSIDLRRTIGSAISASEYIGGTYEGMLKAFAQVLNVSFLARLFRRKSRAIVIFRSSSSLLPRRHRALTLLKKYKRYQYQTWNICSS